MAYSREDYERAASLDQQRQQAGRAEEEYSKSIENDKKSQQPTGHAGDIDTAKNLAKATTPLGFFSLLKKIDFLKDIPFFCAFGFAMLKDLLDLVFAPTVILSILFSILCSIFIFMMLMLAGSGGGKGMVSGLLKKGGFIMGGGVIDSLPGVDFFPAETVTVGIIYFMTLAER